MTLLEKYPNAYEDDKGTIWVSQQAAESADWSYKNGDAGHMWIEKQIKGLFREMMRRGLVTFNRKLGVYECQ